MAEQDARDQELTVAASEEATDELTDDEVDGVSGGMLLDSHGLVGNGGSAAVVGNAGNGGAGGAGGIRTTAN